MYYLHHRAQEAERDSFLRATESSPRLLSASSDLQSEEDGCVCNHSTHPIDSSAMVCNGSCYLKIFEIHLIVIVLVNAFNALHKHTMGKISPTESLARNAVIFISSPSPITCNQHYASTIKQRRQALWYSMTT